MPIAKARSCAEIARRLVRLALERKRALQPSSAPSTMNATAQTEADRDQRPARSTFASVLERRPRERGCRFAHAVNAGATATPPRIHTRPAPSCRASPATTARRRSRPREECVRERHQPFAGLCLECGDLGVQRDVSAARMPRRRRSSAAPSVRGFAARGEHGPAQAPGHSSRWSSAPAHPGPAGPVPGCEASSLPGPPPLGRARPR